MTSEMWVAIISGVLTLVGVIVMNSRSNQKLVDDVKLELSKTESHSELGDEKMHGELQVMHAEMTDLKEEVRKHNNVIERTFRLEETVRAQAEKIKDNTDAIKRLENKM